MEYNNYFPLDPIASKCLSVSSTNCSIYVDYFKNDCKLVPRIRQKLPLKQDEWLLGNDQSDWVMMDLNECLGCYIDNYCNYIANMFNIRPGISFWL